MMIISATLHDWTQVILPDAHLRQCLSPVAAAAASLVQW
eukprot:CAMPEP_0181096686 /NCGR_PEP_ID=MMETSP1071-20121207/11166_1 /TAXON_ID=35127 /ORGANISM="Thalassiosira sp., Strain NH16" /LENGTH=38 /DNA_ID= /DNA_START= /DNA_END= /DNA_ORIENTATION=